MDFAIKTCFASPASELVRAIWDDLAQDGIATFMKTSGSFPGITLGVWEGGHEESLRKMAEAFARKAGRITVESYGLASFPTDPAHVFLGIVPSDPLLQMHRVFHGIDPASSAKSSEFYQPGSWVPHSTLALRCRPDQIVRVTEICLKHKTRFKAELAAVGLVEIGTGRHIASFDLQG